MAIRTPTHVEVGAYRQEHGCGTHEARLELQRQYMLEALKRPITAEEQTHILTMLVARMR